MRALVLRAPGINCDRETAEACRMAGFTTDLVHINQLLNDPDSLLEYQFLAIPGGFSYGDDLGAGTLLAKNLTIHLSEQLRRFVDEGRPVLGICNGFQVLVRAGLLPGSIDRPEATNNVILTENQSAQFECRWIRLAAQESACIFTKGLEGTIELPVAHGEGQFVFNEDITLLREQGLVALVYASETDAGVAYPANPNGSTGHVAGICNAQGNILGLMPHPERYTKSLHHPLRIGKEDGSGAGLLLFKNAFEYASRLASDTQKTITYAASGVDIQEAEQAKRLMQRAVKATHGPEVLAGMGAFAGVIRAQRLQQMYKPALVSSTDGVGTKTILVVKAGRFETIGYDLVNHSVNDLLVQGATPLFFMDYLAMGRLNAIQAAQIVESVARACQEAGCALLGGETAEMPDVYMTSTFDLAGTIVGIVEEEEIISGATICPDDVILGLASSGLHTNGYSLARRIFAEHDMQAIMPELGESLFDALLRPHRSYLKEIQELQSTLSKHNKLKGLAHITGGGFEGNIARILPEGTQAIIETTDWKVPALFQLIARLGNIEKQELYRALNMGIGMVLVMSAEGAREAVKILPELQVVGKIEAGSGVVVK